MSALEGPAVPWEVAYLWRWFLELERSREVVVIGDTVQLKPHTPSEIEAWARMSDRRLLPHEFDALVQLDVAMRFPEEAD